MALQYSKKLVNRFKNPKFVKRIKNPDAVGEVGNMKCLLPGEKIFLDEGFIEIERAKKNDLVLSHDSKKNKILDKLSRRYIGKVITLINALGKISLTPEHLVYSLIVPDKNKFKRNKGKRSLIPGWYHAEHLKKGDIVLYPLPNETKNVKSIKIDIQKSKWDFRSKSIPNKIPLNEDFLRLSGYFLSEGYISEGKSRNYIAICFNTNEEKYAEDVKRIVKKLFNLDVIYRVDKRKKTFVVYIYSAILSRFFKKLFNKGAKNKSIPKIFMSLPPQKQKALLEGLWKGDGYINLDRVGPRAGYSTISLNLFQQVKILLLRQKIMSSAYVEEAKTSKWANHSKSYRIHVGQRDSLKKISLILGIKYNPVSYEAISSWFDDKYLYTPITKIELKSYSGKVYNLEVEKAHSFTSEAFCLHNCGDIMRLELKIEKDRTGNPKIKDIGFQTFGCPAAVSSSDVVCELAKGKTLKQAEKINKDDIIKKLGGMPPIKIHCSILGVEALKKAIKNYEERNGGKNDK